MAATRSVAIAYLQNFVALSLCPNGADSSIVVSCRVAPTDKPQEQSISQRRSQLILVLDFYF